MFKNRSNRNKQNHIPNTLGSGLYCVNCGKNNHSLVACSDPHNSYGLLCFYKNPEHPKDEPKLLMIRRKHTIPYMDFLRGKYDVNNIKYLVDLFSKMTYAEIISITDTCNFINLRMALGLNNTGNRQFKNEYETSELKFNYILKLGLLHRIIICINKIFNTNISVPYELNFSLSKDAVEAEYSGIIDSCIHDIEKGLPGFPPMFYDEPEWGLPKGKREERESDLQTAIREFCEETGLQMNNLRIYKNVIPLEEQYTGMNAISYKHTYFVAELINLSPDKVDKLCFGYVPSQNDSHEQQIEVSKIMLLNQYDALSCIRPFHQCKKNVVHKAFYIMSQYKNFFS
jgi:8-oxo-dGTP pyrophosphatase MutT (NUDIX family)